jgi:PAS domain S-box-containing protein
MPEMDGFEVCKVLKTNKSTQIIPIIMITAARTDKASRIKALEFGADAFLTKPVDESELTAQVRAMLRIKESEDQKLNENERLAAMVLQRTEQLENELKERKRIEKELKDSEERFQMLFNKAPLGYQSLDSEGHFIEVNQQWLDTLGYERKEVLGKWFGDFLAPDYQDAFRQRFPLFKAAGQIHSEFEMVHKTGIKLFIAFDGKIGYNSSGTFKQTHCILQDITESKRTEEALRASEEKYSILFNDSPDSYLIIKDGVFTDCNRAAEEMLRGERSQIIGKAPEELSPEFQPDGRRSSESAKEKIEYAFKKNKNTFEWVHRRFDGTDFFVEVSIAPMKLRGRFSLFTTWRDITKRKIAEEKIKASEDRYRSFISQVSEGVYRLECDEPMDLNLPVEEQLDYIYDHMIVAECNDAFVKMYGLNNQDETMGKGHRFFHGSSTNPANREGLRNFIKNGYRIENSTTEEINLHGQLVYFNNNALGIIENNHLVRMWGTQTDITEKVKADRIQEVLYTISNAALSSISLPKLIEIISEEIGKLIDSTNFYIAFYDEKTDMLSTIYE